MSLSLAWFAIIMWVEVCLLANKALPVAHQQTEAVPQRGGRFLAARQRSTPPSSAQQ
jgi:hypothetical protein